MSTFYITGSCVISVLSTLQPTYNTDLVITQSCCSSQIFLTENVIKELYENDHEMVVLIQSL